MSSIRRWAGHTFGTHIGPLFLKLTGSDSALSGTLHHNDSSAGVTVFRVVGSYDGNKLAIESDPATRVQGAASERIKVSANLQPDGSLRGDWETEHGAAGTLTLFSHSTPEASSQSGVLSDQLHTARHNFGPIVIDKTEIIDLAESIQKDFLKAPLIVTWSAGTEQSRHLADFRELRLFTGRAEVIKLVAREPEGNGVDKIIVVEFGPSVNWAMCQGSSESWALGELEKLKRQIRQFERVYSGKSFAARLDQFLMAGTLVFLPSLTGLRDRAILLISVLSLMCLVKRLHENYLPHAAIYLGEREESRFARVLPAVLSWSVGIAATVVAALLAAYLKGWLGLPT